MAVTSSPRTTPRETGRIARALAVADAGWYTTENLFRALDRPDVSTLLLKCVDYYNAVRRGTPPWRWGRSLTQADDRLWERDLVLPSGWMKSFPSLGMRPIRRAIQRWRGEHAPDGPLTLVMTYPHYLYLRDLVRPDVQVYFNVDDYSQYWPRCAERVNALERQAVRETALTVCVSRRRCEDLRNAVPEAADRIRHLPHGAPSSLLRGGPQHRPAEPPPGLEGIGRPLIGYVGTLEDRVDWALLDRLAVELPHATLVLIGRIARGRPGAWQLDARRCLARPNVRSLGWRPQETLGAYNRAFDVCLIPYRTDHPFNRVCCPTKIMDYLATGRPVVSTSLPECRLYEGLFEVAETPDEFIESVRAILDAGSDDGRAEVRHEWAASNTCERVAERFLEWLPG